MTDLILEKVRLLRLEIEDKLYYNEASLCTINMLADTLIASSESYDDVCYKHFNVYSFVHQNLTFSKLQEILLIDRLSLIFTVMDYFFAITIALRNSKHFSDVRELPRCKSKIQTIERLRGSVDILRRLGYTESSTDKFYFPLSKSGPDQAVIKPILADFCIALREIKYFAEGTHPASYKFSEEFDLARNTYSLYEVTG